MTELKDNWLTDGHIDFEYKKYILLAYLQTINQQFQIKKLYPHLGDLIRHYQNLQHFISQKQIAVNSFPKELKKIDLQNFMLSYDKVVSDDELMGEISKIVDFSLPYMQQYVEEGRQIYDYIEKQLKFYPVGIVPLEKQVGYLFLRNGGDKQTRVYSYQLSLFENDKTPYRGLATRYVNSFTASITNTYEQMKIKIIESEKILIVPAVFLVESDFHFPFGETFLPLARRLLMRHLATGSM